MKTLARLACLFPVVTLSLHARPNIVILFADDMGYGDLSSFGHPTIATPHLDQMAAEGQKWMDFHTAAAVCSPSRAALLTGRYPIRSGLAQRVFFEWSARGMPTEDVTIAEVLKEAGYKTGIIGKWHLGHRPDFLPTRQGFDSYYGIPYSNDMRVDPEMPVSEHILFREGMTLEKMRDAANKVNNWVPLMENEEVIEYPADQTTLTRRYTERALAFIEAHANEPFFLYYAQTFPHVPLFASKDFLGNSKRGLYGDVIEEMDDSVGQILQKLRDTGLDRNTLVLFTSDNGPWLTKDQEGGSAGLLRDGKGTTFEGGFRVPTVFWMPGTIQPAVVREQGSTLDIFHTVSSFAGLPLHERAVDSLDLRPVLLEEAKSPREELFYYRGGDLFAVRKGPWKAHFITQGAYGRGPERTEHNPPLLYHLDHDPSEQHDLSGEHPDVVEELIRIFKDHMDSTEKGPNQYPYYLEGHTLPSWVRQVPG